MTLEPASDNSSNYTVIKFKVTLSVKYFFMPNADRIIAPSSLCISGLCEVNEEDAFLGVQSLSENGTRASAVMTFLLKIELSIDPPSELNFKEF